MRTVLVEVWPEEARARRKATGEVGKRPDNGAILIRVGLVEAADLMADDEDGYNQIVPGSLLDGDFT